MLTLTPHPTQQAERENEQRRKQEKVNAEAPPISPKPKFTENNKVPPAAASNNHPAICSVVILEMRLRSTIFCLYKLDEYFIHPLGEIQ